MNVLKYQCEECHEVMYLPYKNLWEEIKCPNCSASENFTITGGYAVKETIKE